MEVGSHEKEADEKDPEATTFLRRSASEFTALGLHPDDFGQ